MKTMRIRRAIGLFELALLLLVVSLVLGLLMWYLLRRAPQGSQLQVRKAKLMYVACSEPASSTSNGGSQPMRS